MKEIVWLLAVLALAAAGTIVWRVPLIARMNRAAQWALAFAAGLAIAAMLLYVDALLGVRWTRVSIALPLITIAIWGASRRRSVERTSIPWPSHVRWIVAASFALMVYAIADARATCGDLIYIWGPKARAFYTARTIDTTFLTFPFYDLMHPDYPPLVPLTYDIGAIFAHHASLWGPMFLSPFIVLSIVATMRGFGATASAASLGMAILSFAFVAAYLPGGADPFLLLFESIATIALTFAPQERDARWIAAAALAAAAFTKVEGASFAIVVAIAYVMTQRKLLHAITMIAPAALLLGTWLLFAWRHKMLDQYARAHSQMYWSQLRAVVAGLGDHASSYGVWVLWAAAATPMLIRPSWRKAGFPLLVCAGTIAAAIFFYLHNPQPKFWIDTSADRILVTPLMCFAVASAATCSAAEGA